MKKKNILTSDKPTIGITFDWKEEIHDGSNRLSYYEFKYHEYTQAIEKRGANAVVISFNDDVNELSQKLDGLVFSGGRDIHPSYYGQEINGSEIPPNNKRFEFDKSLYNLLPKNIPILGICWGAQFLNVVNGGSLHQDIPTKSLHIRNTVETDVFPGTWLYQTIGKTAHVYCNHHQAVDKIGNGFIVSSIDKNGFIHSIEKVDDEHFQIGLQCHPEVIHSEESNHRINEHANLIFENFIRKTTEFKIAKEKKLKN